MELLILQKSTKLNKEEGNRKSFMSADKVEPKVELFALIYTNFCHVRTRLRMQWSGHLQNLHCFAIVDTHNSPSSI